MPRVKTKVKATYGKPYVCTQCGEPIEPGESYLTWSFRYGGTYRIHARHGMPRRSQLTQSKIAEVYAALEEVEDFIAAGDWTPKALGEQLQTAAEQVQQTASEYEEAAEQFGGGGDNAERAQELDSFASALESASSEIEDADTMANAQELAEQAMMELTL